MTWDTTRKPFPTWFTVDTHNYCNASCSYCPWPKFRVEKDYPKGKMEWPLFTKLIDEMAEPAKLPFVENIRFGNIAESMIVPDIWDNIAYTISKGVPLYITSNMTHVTPEAQDRLDALGWTGTLHAHVQPDMGVDYALQLQNYHAALARWGKERVKLVYLVEGKSLRIWAGDPRIPDRVAHRCEVDRPLHTMMINHDGRVQLCCNDTRQTVILGSVKDRTIADVWNDPEWDRTLGVIMDGQMDLCNHCEWGKS